MAISSVLVFLVSAAYWNSVTCFPMGAPLSACDTLSPLAGPHLAGPQTSEVPYIVDLLSFLDDGNGGLAYNPGGMYEVIVRGNTSELFRGVLLQGRRVSDESAVGSFVAPPAGDLLRLGDCPNEVSVTHVNNSDKASVSATWIAPPAGTGTVRMGFAVVEVRDIYWANQRTVEIAEAGAMDPATTMAMATASVPTDPPMMGNGMGGDPHFSIKLPSGNHLCFSVQGEKDFIFNLVSNKALQMNALFVPDKQREEVTWIGGLGMVIKNSQYKESDATTIRFDAIKKLILIGDDITLSAQNIEKLSFKDGKLSISEAKRSINCTCFHIQVELHDASLSFSVHFIKNNHLDMTWDNVDYLEDSHGIIGQFFRRGVKVDVPRRLLFLPHMAPVPVMRKPIWHFMERDVKDEQQQLCWVAMNPGYQGRKLIEGHYLDYVVDDLLATKLKKQE